MNGRFWFGFGLGLCSSILLYFLLLQFPISGFEIFGSAENSQQEPVKDNNSTTAQAPACPAPEIIRNCEMDPTAASCEPICESKKQAENILLPPPEFKVATNEKVQMTSSEEIKIEWRPVSHASQYLVQIRDDRQNTINTLKTKDLFFKLSKKPLHGSRPGTYLVTLSTINKHGTAGDEGPAKTVILKKADKIEAPTIKNITVED